MFDAAFWTGMAWLGTVAALAVALVVCLRASFAIKNYEGISRRAIDARLLAEGESSNWSLMYKAAESALGRTRQQATITETKYRSMVHQLEDENRDLCDSLIALRSKLEYAAAARAELVKFDVNGISEQAKRWFEETVDTWARLIEDAIKASWPERSNVQVGTDAEGPARPDEAGAEEQGSGI